jgi:hypothetical protein
MKQRVNEKSLFVHLNRIDLTRETTVHNLRCAFLCFLPLSKTLCARENLLSTPDKKPKHEQDCTFGMETDQIKIKIKNG